MIIEHWTGFRTLVKREIFRFFVVATQTILPAIVSSMLFMVVFGMSLGSNIRMPIEGMSYIQFIVPGLVTMHLIESAYTNTSSSLFMSRWQNLIQELLLSPLTYFEMVLGLLIGGMVRGMLVASSVCLLSLFFTQMPIRHPWMVLYFFVAIPFIFSCLGLLVGLWVEGFERLAFWSSFVLTPLIYFGGVFHSSLMVPAPLRFLTRLDPIFYLVSGVRYGMTGVSDAPIGVSIGLAAALAVFLFFVVEYLFRIGYKLRT